MYTVVTSADTNFYNLALGLAETLPSGAPLWLYDLGLTSVEVAALQRRGVTVERIPVPADSFAFNSVNNIRTVHKMDCIEHCIAARNAGVILLDADVLVLDLEALKGLIPAPDEVVVTYRCLREQRPHVLVNGRINAGVMAFGSAVPAAFFQSWKDVCADPEQTDQSALSLLLEEWGVDWTRLGEPQTVAGFSGIRVRVLDGNFYNDTSCRTGGIFHFKSAGRRGSKRLWYQLFVILLRCFPGFVRWAVQENRRRRLLVWKPRAVDARGDA